MSGITAFVFAHFSPNGVVSRSLRGLVAEARRRSPVVHFISTGLNITTDDELFSLAKVVKRQNYGYDFWSYRQGILDSLCNDEVDRLVLINSSFIAYDAGKLFDGLLKPMNGPKIRGLTVSHEISRHAQSYLISIEDKSLLRSHEFQNWWSQMTPITNRSEVIRRYEIGFSRDFSALGVPVCSAYEPSNPELLIALARAIGSLNLSSGEISENRATLDLDKARLLNPTLFLWDFIFRNYAILKIQLLKSNPTKQYLGDLLASLEERREIMEFTREALDLAVSNLKCNTFPNR